MMQNVDNLIWWKQCYDLKFVFSLKQIQINAPNDTGPRGTDISLALNKINCIKNNNAFR